MKKLILLSLVCGSAMLVSADVLYWMVDDAHYAEDNRSFTFAYASLAAQQGTTFNSKTADYLDTRTFDPSVSSTGALASEFAARTYDGYSFFIELMSDQGDMAQVLNIGTYADLVAGNYLKNSQMQTEMNTYKASAFNVPEPTSGLLMLLGVGLLGLKRKKV